MKSQHAYNLTPSEVAEHFALRPATVRGFLRAGHLTGVRIGGAWRLSWSDVWAAESGPRPHGQRRDDYKQPLLTKRSLAAEWGVSERTVERWIQDGLPTRTVRGSVRIAPADAASWMKATFDASLSKAATC